MNTGHLVGVRNERAEHGKTSTETGNDKGNHLVETPKDIGSAKVDDLVQHALHDAREIVVDMPFRYLTDAVDDAIRHLTWRVRHASILDEGLAKKEINGLEGKLTRAVARRLENASRNTGAREYHRFRAGTAKRLLEHAMDSGA